MQVVTLGVTSSIKQQQLGYFLLLLCFYSISLHWCGSKILIRSSLGLRADQVKMPLTPRVTKQESLDTTHLKTGRLRQQPAAGSDNLKHHQLSHAYNRKSFSDFAARSQNIELQLFERHKKMEVSVSIIFFFVRQRCNL